jgi:signal transduction histidine kinase
MPFANLPDPQPALNPGILRRLLLIEDSDGDADITCDRLVGIDGPPFEISRVTRLDEAKRLLRRYAFDAIVLDLNLPDSRGEDTVRMVRDAANETPIFVLSSLLDERVRASALRMGADEAYSKDDPSVPLEVRLLHAMERYRANVKLHRLQLESLLDAMPDAILVANLSGQLRFVNPAALTLFGRTREDLLVERLAFSLPDGEPHEISILRSGESRVCEMRVVSIEWEGEAAHLASIRDITLRRQAEELRVRSVELELENRRILEANRLKSEFLANMSHELRTPLNAIIGFSELLSEGRIESSSDTHRKFVGHILSSGKHLLQLINDVLDLAKVEAGKISFHPEVAQLPVLVNEVVAVLGSLAVRRQVHIEVDHDPSLGEVYIDPGRFKQVLYNYLSNAIKFTSERGRVVLRTRPECDTLFRVEVEDTGAGISASDMDRLFQEFQQLETGASKRHGGTGLGLALTKRMVEAQGGTVGVASVVGQGTVFHAVLPRYAQPHEETAP